MTQLNARCPIYTIQGNVKKEIFFREKNDGIHDFVANVLCLRSGFCPLSRLRGDVYDKDYMSLRLFLDCAVSVHCVAQRDSIFYMTTETIYWNPLFLSLPCSYCYNCQPGYVESIAIRNTIRA